MATEEEIKPLRKDRGNIKRALTSSETILSEINSDTDLQTLNLHVRLQNHLTLWDRFEITQTKIDNLTDEVEMESQFSERTDFEHIFHRISALYQKHIQKLNVSEISPTQSIHSDTSFTNNGSNPSNQIVVDKTTHLGLSRETETQNLAHSRMNQSQFQAHARFELPKIKTPTFEGCFDTWLTFHDSFKSMCHNNQSISPIQKFHYLKACLTGEAAEVISSLETTESNYDVAWNLLKERFDNRKFIAESHVHALFELSTVSKEVSVRSLLDNFQKRYRALRALDQPVEQWDTLLIYILRMKLNNYNREKWEESVGSTQLPSLKKMTDFLEQRALIEGTQTMSKLHVSKNQVKNSVKGSTCLTTTVQNEKPKFKFSCPICQKPHMLYTCQQFQNLSLKERYDVVKKASICFNCFFSNHKTNDCRKEGCHKWYQKHHTMLQFEKEKVEESKDIPSTTTSLVKFEDKGPSQVLLGTVVIDILDGKGKYQPCRALLDSCSQCNAITAKFAERLCLSQNSIDIKLRGVENLQSKISRSVSSQIKSRYHNSNLYMKFLIFQEISEAMPCVPLDRRSINVPEGIFLADPSFHDSREIDILIGAEYFYQLLHTGQIRVNNQTAVFQETDLGWILSGRVTHSQKQFNAKSKPQNKIICNVINLEELPILWEIGEDKKQKILSEEKVSAENHYSETIKRLESGSYKTELPFNEKKNLFGKSSELAFQRFYSLEKKFLKNPVLKEQYSDCIQGYLDEGHMSLLKTEDTQKPGYFLPHHAVFKEDSITTKTRVVFNGSAKSSTGISLNDTFFIGPTIQNNLFSIVLRFRSFPYALTADIQQMYRQIEIAEKDRVFQKILWRFSPEEPIQIYTLNTVTFGTSCAPFLAIRTLHQLADDEENNFPLASMILKRDFNVDDVLTGSQTFQGALQLRNDLIELLRRGGFVLRKWASNHAALCTDFLNNQSDNYMSLDLFDTIKTLGLYWDPKSDTIMYTANQDESTEILTKRLSIQNRYFWSYSSIVLNWVNTPPHKLKTFVANRVSEIQALTHFSEWKHVPTKENLADFISRGQNSENFLENLMWISGSQWLCQKENTWPQLEIQTLEVPDRVIAYCQRFISSCKIKNAGNRETGSLTTCELEKATITIIKLVQSESFSEERKALMKNQEVPKRVPSCLFIHF
ncbi:uncharacterized protein LOC127285374 [Leptopilina boulardi]|uniref:uncharacterized protein LOC127285374 n=1 Tax=Leptopilina boulardi TaxID=63433 RepID=UPI0021F68D35|nr:uncharacterized protein LOC127285374 [Leptopilina boulardi]